MAAAILSCIICQTGNAQIVNRLKVDGPTFERYAYGRMQQFSPDNLALADSLYHLGETTGNYRYKCLGLSLEFPVRFALGEYSRMDEAVAELKEILAPRKDVRAFYFSSLHEYCEYLIRLGRISEAMLLAREMERTSTAEKKPLGRMYSYRIIGLIQSYRDNSFLATRNLLKAVRFCKEAHAEQDLPNLYILIAQEYINMSDFVKAESYCAEAEVYQNFFPGIRLKALMTRAYLYNAEKDWTSFWKCYDALVKDPLYEMQFDSDARCEIDICFLRSKGLFLQALERADALGTARDRHSMKHGIYAALSAYDKAYSHLDSLMAEKDSIYIRVQNEDLAILDAEMNNAALRQEAERLKHQNQNTILLGFMFMFAIAFLAILLSQWQLRANLETLKERNNQMLIARRAYQKALDSKEAENSLKIKILQNRKSNTFKL